MRITVDLDDLLLEEAILLTGNSDLQSLIEDALKALIERESPRRLIALGGSEPAAQPVPRRRLVE